MQVVLSVLCMELGLKSWKRTLKIQKLQQSPLISPQGESWLILSRKDPDNVAVNYKR